MAIALVATVLASALWPQGDIRDPLGTWGFRLGVTGDATGGEIKVTAQAPAGLAAAYVYTCYSLNVAQLTGTLAANAIMARLLANWPNIDALAGVQGYSTALTVLQAAASVFTAPQAGYNDPLVAPQERFILLFDPRPGVGALSIAELKLGINIDTDTYSFEGYGYFWDRSVLQAPGGPRHPGAS